jgi:hypothetical protein
MMTLLILFTILYVFSLYKIKKGFGICESNFLFYLIFIFGTGIIVLAIIIFLLYIIDYNRLP